MLTFNWWISGNKISWRKSQTLKHNLSRSLIIFWRIECDVWRLNGVIRKIKWKNWNILSYVVAVFSQRDTALQENESKIENLEKQLAETKQASQQTEYEKEQQITALRADLEKVCYVTELLKLRIFGFCPFGIIACVHIWLSYFLHNASDTDFLFHTTDREQGKRTRQCTKWPPATTDRCSGPLPNRGLVTFRAFQLNLKICRLN